MVFENPDGQCTCRDMKLRSGFLLTVGLSSLLIVLFVNIVRLPAPFTWMELDSYSSLGDSISGLTAPAIGLIGIILLVLTLYEQVRLGQQMVSENKRNSYESIISSLERAIANLTFRMEADTQPATGVAAIALFLSELEGHSLLQRIFLPMIRDVELITSEMMIVIDQLEAEDQEFAARPYLVRRVQLVYTSQLGAFVQRVVEFSGDGWDRNEPSINLLRSRHGRLIAGLAA